LESGLKRDRLDPEEPPNVNIRAKRKTQFLSVVGRVRDLAVAGTREASEAVHRHPYQALGVGLGIAALLGYLIVRRCSSDDD